MHIADSKSIAVRSEVVYLKKSTVSAKTQPSKSPREFRNNKIGRDYIIEDTIETGIVLLGTEVKAIRQSGVQINEAFARFDKERLMLYHAHIPEYHFANLNNHDPYRPRQLLIKKRESKKLQQAALQNGRALVPKKIYFKKALIKVELALCTGKKLYDKREAMKKKTELREAEREMKRFQRM